MWFGVSLLYREVHRIPDGIEPIWEESVVLIEATSADRARELAIAHARQQEVQFEVAEGDAVRWTFESVLDVFPITSETVGSGVEVFSRFL
jgi:hypothetical protein